MTHPVYLKRALYFLENEKSVYVPDAIEWFKAQQLDTSELEQRLPPLEATRKPIEEPEIDPFGQLASLRFKVEEKRDIQLLRGELLPRTTTTPQDQQIQEQLTDTLTHHAEQLKQQSLAFSSALNDEKDHLNKLEATMDQQNTRLTSSSKEMKSVSGSTWSTTIIIWLAVIGGVVLFVFMFVYMRFIGHAGWFKRWMHDEL